MTTPAIAAAGLFIVSVIAFCRSPRPTEAAPREDCQPDPLAVEPDQPTLEIDCPALLADREATPRASRRFARREPAATPFKTRSART